MEKKIIVITDPKPLQEDKQDPGQEKANEVMDQVLVKEIWRTKDNHWFTTEEKAQYNQSLIGGELQHFTKN